jgi:SAM-dependent methyltransferase
MNNQYYNGINPDLLAKVPLNAKIVIEVGCGSGRFALAYLSLNPQARYIGIELHGPSSVEARSRLATVIEGDVESDAVLKQLDSALKGDLADVLIFGDVLEHLVDPWKVLRQLRDRVRVQGVCVACIPNVSHWSLLQQQLSGSWEYSDSGLLDRTHLRFFTRRSAESLFNAAGWEVADSSPRVLWPDKTSRAIEALAPAALALGVDVESFKSDVSAFQWILRGVNGVVQAPLTVAGLGMQKVAGVTEARIDYPLYALRSIPGLRVVWSSGGLSLPRDWCPGVFILHRQFLNMPRDIELVEALVARGWLVITDMDDDPNHWAQFSESSFRAFCGVHAVTVTTDTLARVVEQWNPEVAVLPNQVFQMQHLESSIPKSQRVRIFFGALNRQQDWFAVKEGIVGAALELQDEVEWVVVYDRAFYDALPSGVVRRFYNMLPPHEYIRLLAECDVSLLPLLDTQFNRMKSDLKFIEACGVGAVPVCSSIVYGDNPALLEVGCFADSPQQWLDSIVELCRNKEELARRRNLGLTYVSSQRMHGPASSHREALYREWFLRRDELEKLRVNRLSSS